MHGLDDVLTNTEDGAGAPTGAPQPPALLVTKADLIVALRAYLPHLSDIETLDGGERFLLQVRTEHGPDRNGAG